MSQKIVVFVGPSLEVSVARSRLAANYRSPVRRGDVADLLARQPLPQHVAIIDGEFGQSLAVSVSEIRSLLQAGVKVWGAASMGALRAVECACLGMKGIGWIYKGYQAGDLQADDEVALLFDPVSQRAVTQPLVNIRWALQLAIASDVLPQLTGDELLAVAKHLSYKERTYAALIEAAPNTQLRTAARILSEFVERSPKDCDRKRLDALLLLDAVEREVSRVAR